jgi:hypothetical protein
MFEEPPARRGKWKGEATTQEHTPFLGKHPWAPKGGQKYRLTPFGDAFMRASAVSNVGVCCRRDFILASIEERLWPLGMTFNKLSAREVEKAENLANKSLTAAMEALVRFRFFQPSGAPGAYRMTEIGEHYFLECRERSKCQHFVGQTYLSLWAVAFPFRKPIGIIPIGLSLYTKNNAITLYGCIVHSGSGLPTPIELLHDGDIEPAISRSNRCSKSRLRIGRCQCIALAHY